MPAHWRAAGLTYVRFSNYAAQILRNTVKEPLRTQIAYRNGSEIKLTFYQNGKPIKKEDA
eukprot:CAMPEP_0184341188 /NCGR_PEP_ID=MMETSP1089-20130417/9816_1 /TAXON_ID=38269 ORGANISM="Gloeochaete wittrockiana, Strain SAG46.84" /NCGR_SAMPLE_ID=MMETSP1089 /ASSEMBLY_ACC=CAM_ASM_000445 /LENGTH=59 /DNA_ID=CAMNT_0026669351 /DNA_START=44 /DNA_END=223 /DNA_ORIENTATION=-